MGFLTPLLSKIDPAGNRLGFYGSNPGDPIDPLGNAIMPRPTTPDVPSAPAAPTLANASSALDDEAQKAARAMSGGRTSTMLNGAQGVNDSRYSSKILLGS